jgi:DnaJ-class molecular chaperone
MNAQPYWVESVTESLEEAGITATADQINMVAENMQISSEQHDTSFGLDVASDNLRQNKDRKIEELYAELAEERDKRPCRKCGGSGSLTTHGPCHSSTSRCYACNGTGKVK